MRLYLDSAVVIYHVERTAPFATAVDARTQIFASRYKPYLPTEAELAAELQRERLAIELQ